MASPQEIEETLTLIRRAWGKAPMLRLGQLLGNCAPLAGCSNLDIYYHSNKDLREGLRKFIKEVKIV